MVVTRIAAFWLVALNLMTTAASAGDCRYDYCWGAIAAGERGVSARASSMRTAIDAWDRVEKVCDGKCGEILVFPSGCGVIVQAGRETTVSGFGADIDLAMSEAVLNCEATGARSCPVRVQACSS